MIQIVVSLMVFSVAPSFATDAFKRCNETMGQDQTSAFSVFRGQSPQSAEEFLEVFNPRRVPEFRVPMAVIPSSYMVHLLSSTEDPKFRNYVRKYVSRIVFSNSDETGIEEFNLNIRDHDEIALALFAAVLVKLPKFFAFKPSSDQILDLLRLPDEFIKGSLTRNETTWLYTRAFLEAASNLAYTYLKDDQAYRNLFVKVESPFPVDFSHPEVEGWKARWMNNPSRRTHKSIVADVRLMAAEPLNRFPEPNPLPSADNRTTGLLGTTHIGTFLHNVQAWLSVLRGK